MANKVQLTKYYVQIIADANDADFLRLISHFSGIERVRQKNTYRCSLSLLPEVLDELRGITSAEQLSGTARSLYEEEMLRRQMTAELKRLGPDEHTDGFWTHQDLGVCLARYNRRYNFFYDTRTGKTRMSYRIMFNALKEGRAKRCLVVAPSSIIPDWLSDAAIFPQLKVVAYYKDQKTKEEALRQPCHVMIFSAGMVAANVSFLERIGFDMCIFDESSSLKSPKSQLSAAALRLSESIPSWYNLSATPAPNGLYEYYVQMRTVDAYSFSPAITRYRQKYFDDVSKNPKYNSWKIKPNMREEFMEVVKSRSIFVDQKVMPMAAKEWHVEPFELEEKTWGFYRQMATDMCVQLEGKDEAIIADQSVAMRAKLNQIASGFVLDTEAIRENRLLRKIGEAPDGKESYRLDSTERLRALGQLLDFIERKEPGASVVIWANYTEEFKMIKEYLGDHAEIIKGGTTAVKREAIISRFRAGITKYLVAHPLSVGRGINLTVSHHAIYYSMNDSYEALKQSSERICGHIDVQPKPCHFYVLQARHTVNEIIYQNVSNKQDASLGFMEHLKAVALQ